MQGFFILILAFLAPSIALAAPGTYKLMAPIGTLVNESLTSYLQGIVQFIIGAAGILAVIMIVICGMKLIGSPSASGKAEAKECIQNALFGVLLAIGAWVILYTINPLLLSNSVKLADVAVAPATAPTPGVINEPYPTKPGFYYKFGDAEGNTKYQWSSSAELCVQLAALAEKEGASLGITIRDEAGQRCFEVRPSTSPISGGEKEVRQLLCGNDSCVGSKPIAIRNGPCPMVGAKGCTNVGGLVSSVISAVKALQGACGCTITITGGTEWWSHKTHGSAGNFVPVVDIRKETQGVDKFLWTNGTGKRASFIGQRVFYGGFWWTDERDHWHACQDTQPQFYCRNCMDAACTRQAPPQ